MTSAYMEIISSIASCIGIDELEEFLGLSNKLGILYHGVKKRSSLSEIERDGIKPLTPEGHCSFWTTGWRTFVNRLTRCEGMATYDTPWFHYGTAALVLTDHKSLQRYGDIEWMENGLITIPFIVPREVLTIAQYVPISPLREDRRLEEGRRFKNLLSHLRNYTTGKTIPATQY